MKRYFALVLLLVALPLLNGCATLFTGTDDIVTFESSPVGAEILVNGIEKGKTPVSVPIKRSVNSAEVVLRFPGYETRVFKLEQEFNYVSLLNLFNVLFWGIDVVTGAVLNYRPTYYEFNLQPKGMVERLIQPSDQASTRILAMKDLEKDAEGRIKLPKMKDGQERILIEDVFPDNVLIISRSR